MISKQYAEQNRLLHADNKVQYGQGGHKHLEVIVEIMNRRGCTNVLDYGCGKATLSMMSHLVVVNYDPALPRYAKDPHACDLVVSIDVLEHVEPDFIDDVLNHIQKKMLIAGYFVINTRRDKTKLLPDGRNPHQLVRSAQWWREKLSEYFEIEAEEFRKKKHYIVEVVKKR